MDTGGRRGVCIFGRRVRMSATGRFRTTTPFCVTPDSSTVWQPDPSPAMKHVNNPALIPMPNRRTKNLSMRIEPIFTFPHFNHNRDLHRHRVLHTIFNNRQNLVALLLKKLEDKFVMHLHDHFRFVVAG